MTPGPGDLHVIARAQRRARVLSRVCGCVAVSVGLLVCIGWTLDVPVLRYLFRGYPEMKMNAALAFILGGVPLALGEQGAAWRAHVRRVCAALIGAIAALTLIQYVAGVGLG